VNKFTTKKPKILLTSALPYANGAIHIGHLVEYIQTDIFARFLRLIGEDVIYCCADDAHGTAIEISAEEEGIKPEELIKRVSIEHQKDFATFHIKFDNYHSTHSEENKKIAYDIYDKLKKKGLIYTKDIESFYDEKAKRFLPDRYVKGECPKCGAEDQYGDVCEKCNSTYKPIDLVNPYSTITKTHPVRKSSKHYFFQLSALTDKLKAYFKEKEFQPEILNYLNNWLEEGLNDWDISRDGPYFGFNIPGEDNKYFYVWLDAPIGYLASCKQYCDKNKIDADDYFFNRENKMIHVIGKDIIYFHFLFWPAMLMEAGYNLPDDIHVHGFLTVNKEKMSKSRGTFFTAKEFAEKYNPEYLRYYYAKVLSKKMADIDLDFDNFRKEVNNELVGNIGNLCHRILSFTNKHFDGKVVDFNEKDYPFVEEILKKTEEIKKNYREFNFNKAISEIMEISALGNKFFQDNTPWTLVKEDNEKAAKVCAVSCNIIRNLSILISPVLPVFSENLQKQLNVDKLTWDDINFSLKDHKLNEAELLVEKIRIKEKVETEEDEKKEVLFPASIKIAVVKEAKLHPNSDKLIIMQIDLGNEQRQIVAGLQGHYTAEDMVGKNLVVVTNLKPAKLGGELSNGMLLAACNDDESKVIALETPNAKPGDVVTCGNLKNDTKELKFPDFKKLKIITKDKKIYCKDFDAYLKTEKEEIILDEEDNLFIS